MLKLVSELVVRIADLAEAEGRTLRQMILRLLFAAAIIAGVTVLLLGGVGLLLAAGYMGLARALGPAWAALLMGLASLGIAGGVLWMNREKLK